MIPHSLSLERGKSSYDLMDIESHHVATMHHQPTNREHDGDPYRSDRGDDGDSYWLEVANYARLANGTVGGHWHAQAMDHGHGA